MKWIGTTISIVTIAGLALALYLAIALPLLQEPPAHNIAGAVTGSPPRSAPAMAALAPPVATRPDAIVPIPAATGSRLLEIHGRVSDADGRPLEDVLVTEERFFASTRTDVLGAYRLLLELPRQRLPILNYLRSGYRGQRIHLSWAQLAERPVYPLDVKLADSEDTLRLDGRVSNDIGTPLEGARITIRSADTSSDRLFYLTVFSDERGQFSLEGARAEMRYHLTATLAPHYPVFSNPDFYLGNEAKPLEIVLKSLRFVNLGGMILTRDGTPVADLEFYIKNQATGLHTRKITSDSSGFFTLESFPLGEVVLTTRGAEFFRIKGLKLTGENHANLALMVDRGDVYLGGWVSDSNRLPLEKVMVTLETRRRIDGVEYYSYRSQTTDASGRFAFANLARGEHRVSAYASGFATLKLTHRVGQQSQPLQLVLQRPD